MDELVQLRSLVAGEPTEDEEARAEVWRRLSAGRPDRRSAPRRRLGVVTGFAVCVAVVTAMFTVRSGPIGVEPAEAACGGSGASSSECVRALASFNASELSGTGSSEEPRRIVFASHVNVEEGDLYSMNPDGTDLRQLTRGPLAARTRPGLRTERRSRTTGRSTAIETAADVGYPRASTS